MGLLNVQVSRFFTNDLPRDYVENSLWFRDTGDDGEGFIEGLFLPDVSPDWDATATDWATRFHNWFSGTGSNLVGTMGTTVKIYDQGDAKPRAPKGEATVAPTGTRAAATLAPQQIALCLSYFGGRNLPRRRGRIYVGPVSSATAEPTAANMAYVGTLANMIGGLQVQVPDPGTNTDIAWVVYSRVGNQLWKATDWWVDNEWDIQRRRGVRADSRSTGSITNPG